MSRGLGKLQRDILVALRQNKSLPVNIIAWMAYGLPPTAEGDVDVSVVTPSHRAATERSLLGLQRHGLAFAIHRGSHGGWEWSGRHAALAYAERVVNVFGPRSLSDSSQALREAVARHTTAVA